VESRPAGEVARPGTFTVRAAPGGGLLLERKAILVSLCMIVRDNAGTLEACLRSIRPWVDEMVVVDTGSRDDTPRIAERLGTRVFHFPWCDDFSAARNESLRHARGQWIFWMDSDDTIDLDCGRKLRELVTGPTDASVLGYVMQVHCPGPGEGGRADVTVVDHVKLFRNLPALRFEGRIHEQILPAIRRADGKTAWTDLFVTHSGYDHTPEGQEKKKERDLRLLHLEHGERGEHPFTLFNLGMTYADVGRHREAVDYLKRSIAHSTPGESHLRKAYALLVSAHAQLGEREAARVACAEGLRLFPEDAELRFRRAILLHESGRLQEAADTYLTLLGQETARYFTSVDPGIRGFKARQNLAVVYADLGDLARAEEQWRQVVAEVPRYRQGWRGLAEVLLRQGRADEVLALAERLPGDGALRGEAALLRGQVAAARGDQEAARRELRRAAAECPDDPGPWQSLCRVLFEHGEPAEAEEALQELLRREPKDAAAHHNLGTVYQRQARHEAAVAAYEQSLRLRPDSPGTYFQLGHALRAGGRLREAVAAWKDALRLQPDHAEAREALRQVQPAPVGG
jgi:tetratricopeptide (TPR) repeat protein